MFGLGPGSKGWVLSSDINCASFGISKDFKSNFKKALFTGIHPSEGLRSLKPKILISKVTSLVAGVI